MVAGFEQTDGPSRPAPGGSGGSLGAPCPGCRRALTRRELETHQFVCPHCGHHFRLGAGARLRTLLDGATWKEHDAGLVSADPLAFRDRVSYRERLREGMAATGLRDAAIAASGTIAQMSVEIVAMEYRFLGGTMGVVVGEKIARAAERALTRGRPLVIVYCSSGARMMEGALSLMQMAKVGAALGRLDRARVPYVSLLTDPTTGGVAGCAMVADIVIAEPRALVGFAPPHVIARTADSPLPPDFQRAEFLLTHGLVDMVVDRGKLRAVLGDVLRWLGAPPAAAPQPATADTPDGSADLPLD
jgi:acetyl-CoA carboxylase carboxyl transferase subunit beta